MKFNKKTPFQKESKLEFIILGIIVPIILIFLLFWFNPTTKVPIQNDVMSNGMVKVTKLKIDSKFKDLLKTARSVFQVPFDLSEYTICLANRTKIVPSIGDEMYIEVKVFLADQNEQASSTPIILPKNDIECIKVRIDPFLLGVDEIGVFPVNEDVLKRNGPTIVKYIPDVSADINKGAQPTLNTRLVSTMIFLLAYGGLVKLCSDYRKWFKRSMLKLDKN